MYLTKGRVQINLIIIKMKKFFLATITVVSIAFTVTSCSSDDDNNHKTIIQVSELHYKQITL